MVYDGLYLDVRDIGATAVSWLDLTKLILDFNDDLFLDEDVQLLFQVLRHNSYDLWLIYFAATRILHHLSNPDFDTLTNLHSFLVNLLDPGLF